MFSDFTNLCEKFFIYYTFSCLFLMFEIFLLKCRALIFCVEIWYLPPPLKWIAKMPCFFLLDGPFFYPLIHVAMYFLCQISTNAGAYVSGLFILSLPHNTTLQKSILEKLLSSFNYYSFSISFIFCISSPSTYIFLKLVLIVLDFYHSFWILDFHSNYREFIE